MRNGCALPNQVKLKHPSDKGQILCWIWTHHSQQLKLRFGPLGGEAAQRCYSLCVENWLVLMVAEVRKRALANAGWSDLFSMVARLMSGTSKSLLSQIEVPVKLHSNPDHQARFLVASAAFQWTCLSLRFRSVRMVVKRSCCGLYWQEIAVCPWLRKLIYCCGIRKSRFNFFAQWSLS